MNATSEHTTNPAVGSGPVVPRDGSPLRCTPGPRRRHHGPVGPVGPVGPIGPAGPVRDDATAGDLVEVLDLMAAVLGPPERMESPRARAVYLLNRTRLKAAMQPLS